MWDELQQIRFTPKSSHVFPSLGRAKMQLAKPARKSPFLGEPDSRLGHSEYPRLSHPSGAPSTHRSEGLREGADPAGWGCGEFLRRVSPLLASRTSSCTSAPSGAAPRTDVTSPLLSASAPAFSASSQRSVAQLSGMSGDKRRENGAGYTDKRHPRSSVAPRRAERCIWSGVGLVQPLRAQG